MRQVLIRQKLLSGDSKMIRADVLSQKDGMLRVKMPGQLHPVEVEESAVVNPVAVFGNRDQRVAGVLPKAYPSSPSALGNRFR